MKHKMYSIYDKVAGEFSPPWIGVNDGVGLRQFKQLLQENPNIPPSDAQLFCVGYFEDKYPASFENDFYPVEIKEGE